MTNQTGLGHSPGVPTNLPTVVASSATPVLIGPPQVYGVTTQAFSTETTNIWPAVLTEQGVAVSYSSSTPIVLPSQIGLFP